MIFKSFIIEKDKNFFKNKKLFLFYGENLGMKNYFKNIIKSDNKENEILRFNQDEILKKKTVLIEELNNVSLFAEQKKIFLIEQLNDGFIEILREIEPKIDDQKIFLFADVLEKKSKLRNYFEKSKNYGIVACYPDNDMTLKKIITDELHEFEGLSSNNINMILENSNLDRVKLYNELSKIKTYFQNKRIDTESLEKILDLKINDDFGKLRDEALKGNKTKTNKLLSETILEPEKNILYLNTINHRINKLLDILEESNGTKNLSFAIENSKPPIFWKDKPNIIEQAKKWNKSKLRQIYKKTYELEVQTKSSSTIDNKICIKKLVIDICDLANS